MKYVQLMQVCRKGESWENRKTVKCILNTVVWNKNKQKWVILSGRQNAACKWFVGFSVGAAYLWWQQTCTIAFESKFQRSSTNTNSTTDFRFTWQCRVLRISKQNTKAEVFVWSTIKKQSCEIFIVVTLPVLLWRNDLIPWWTRYS